MRRDQAVIGVRVRCAGGLAGVPAGTPGVIDEDYGSGVMVAWDLPGRPLPAGYKEHDRKQPLDYRPNIVRDGFDKSTELDLLELAA